MQTGNARFCFYPVGQGLFYSGDVPGFRFIYDCGTSSGIRHVHAAVDSYVGEGDRALDMLIISHFHADHFNAVPRLLNKVNGPREVVLPYLLPHEKLMAGAGYAIRNNVELSEPEIELLTDPATFFSSRSDASISLLVPPARPEDTLEDAVVFEAPDRGWNSLPLNQAGTVYLRPYNSVYFAEDWVLRFYCKGGRWAADAIDYWCRQLANPIDITTGGRARLASILRTRIKDLAWVYRKAFRGSAGQNDTSVICCHGPRRAATALDRSTVRVMTMNSHSAKRNAVPVVCPVNFGPHHHVPCIGVQPSKIQYPGHLLTGDAKFTTQELHRVFGRDLENICTGLASHHGASSNWPRDLPDVVHNCVAWVVSCGLGNSYGHPGNKTVESILNSGTMLLLSNQLNAVAIEQ